MGYIISGIQQVGIGVHDADQAWTWYRKNFGMDVPVFKDSATASLMTRYTGDRAEDRRVARVEAGHVLPGLVRGGDLGDDPVQVELGGVDQLRVRRALGEQLRGDEGARVEADAALREGPRAAHGDEVGRAGARADEVDGHD